MRDLLMFIWQLPQNLLGLLLVNIYRPEAKRTLYCPKDGCRVAYYVSSRMSGGISLGKYIIVHHDKYTTIWHEHGHQIQSKMLGWLYLPTVGLVSGMRAWLNLYKDGHYYDSWPENWADRLGGVSR